MHIRTLLLAAAATGLAFPASAQQPDGIKKSTVTAEFNQVNETGVGEAIGTVTFTSTIHGVLITPDLRNLEPGLHGFHIHQNPECGPAEQEGRPVAAAAAGGHWDPQKTESHQGPYENRSHKGDLPALFVDQEGRARHPVLAPRIKLKDLAGHAIIIHQGGDNYADEPEPLGGGGARVACAVVREAR